MLTTIVIGNTGYSSSGVAYAGFTGAGGTLAWADARISGLRWTPADDAYASLEFTALACGPAIPFVPGLSVQLVFSNDDGSSPVLRFTGDLQRPQMQPSDQGPAWAYSCTDLKRRGDYVTVMGPDGTGTASFNLQPDDPLYLFNLAGQTAGQIIQAVLCTIENATALSNLGIGAYTSLTPPTLPSTTLTDLAALTVVPPVPIQLAGESIFATLDGLLTTWCPQYTSFVQADGTYRVIPLFGRTQHTLNVPGDTGGDPVFGLAYTGPDLTGCFSAVQIIGTDIQGAVLSVLAGTLKSAATAPDLAAWTLASFNSPTNTNDQGNTSTVTAASCVVTSDHSTVHWLANFWNGQGGVIVLENPLIAGLATITTFRQVTSCTAMTPGGTATITWDSSLPLDSTAYSRYRLYSTNSPINNVDRLFNVREPATGALGTATFIGSHLYPRFPYGFPWVQAADISTIFYPSAAVLWSPTGTYPFQQWPIGCQVNPKTGQIQLSQPAVMTSAAMAGQLSALNSGYPTTFLGGLWADVQVCVPYNRGSISARSPASGFTGGAFTKYGLERVKTISLGSFAYKGDTANITALAAEHLAVVQEPVIEGSISILFDEYTFTWDPFTLGYALQIAMPGGVSEIDGVELPVRSFTMEWNVGAAIHTLQFNFSTRHRAFEGDALYTPKAFSGNGWGMQGEDLLIGGEINGMGGIVSAKDYSANASRGPSPSPDEGAGDSGSGADDGDVGGMQAGVDQGGNDTYGRWVSRKERDAARAKKRDAAKSAGSDRPRPLDNVSSDDTGSAPRKDGGFVVGDDHDPNRGKEPSYGPKAVDRSRDDPGSRAFRPEPPPSMPLPGSSLAMGGEEAPPDRLTDLPDDGGSMGGSP